ncbi:MarR family transcriptional regulator [Streptomyces sp. AS58]|uniref:MarR family transcriptional regulator n=1 Tax=Streptomyces cadmiisoli TaxID=2184053 RepID=A0A2Z4IVA1_9ACTN|nr:MULTISPECIES: MarR family transcriptional regulator [Streptomyces]AWW36548.1 MarR family transcriptional regulator [Streptomyces cadmiisoli]KOV52717.1 MarR family transcriptional regulator [Streptomyces sp. AS58]
MTADPQSRIPSRASGTLDDTSPFTLGLLLRRAHWRANAALAEALRPLGIELRHYAVLMEIADRGPTVQRDLAGATGSDKAGIMRVVDDLERRGLAVRKCVPGDRRVRAVEITPEGVRVFEAAHAVALPAAERLAAGLEPGELGQLTELLTRLSRPAAREA